MKKSHPKKSKKRQRPALRRQILRIDATIRHAEAEVRRVFGLPEGCFRFVLRSGRKARDDKLVGSLLQHWGTKP
ncbi:MAG: hypothetical protein JNK49_03205 [Planctomycetes bacterium]|nr:hypothetical protein [Planctomycetota bacterium]